MVLGSWLKLMILELFSIFNNSTILCLCYVNPLFLGEKTEIRLASSVSSHVLLENVVVRHIVPTALF